MLDPYLILTAVTLIAIALFFLVRQRLRSDAAQKDRQGDTTDPQIEVSSFGTSGPQSYSIPSDPQEYAKMFVPKDAKK